MKAFEPYNISNFTYPEEMKIIMEYLKAHGNINITASRVEDLYSEFTENKYCAGWMSVDVELLVEFADYLSKKEV